MPTKTKSGAADSRSAKPSAKKPPERKLPRKRNRVSPAAAERRLKPTAPEPGSLGRPVRQFDPAAAKEILGYAKKGLPMGLACLGTCSLDVLVRWMDEEPSFGFALQKARREFALTKLQSLDQGKAGQWQRDAWQLERMYPEYFGLKADVNVTQTHKFEVSATVCAEIQQSWKEFSKTLKVVEADQPKPIDV